VQIFCYNIVLVEETGEGSNFKTKKMERSGKNLKDLNLAKQNKIYKMTLAKL